MAIMRLRNSLLVFGFALLGCAVISMTRPTVVHAQLACPLPGALVAGLDETPVPSTTFDATGAGTINTKGLATICTPADYHVEGYKVSLTQFSSVTAPAPYPECTGSLLRTSNPAFDIDFPGNIMPSIISYGTTITANFQVKQDALCAVIVYNLISKSGTPYRPADCVGSACQKGTLDTVKNITSYIKVFLPNKSTDPDIQVCREGSVITIKQSAKQLTDTNPPCPSGGPPGGGPPPSASLSTACDPITKYVTISASGNGIATLDLVVDLTYPESGSVTGGGTAASYSIFGTHTFSVRVVGTNGAVLDTYDGIYPSTGACVEDKPTAKTGEYDARNAGSCEPFTLKGWAMRSYMSPFSFSPEFWYAGFGYTPLNGTTYVMIDGVPVPEATITNQYDESAVRDFYWTAYVARFYNVTPHFNDADQFMAWYAAIGELYKTTFGFTVQIPARFKDGNVHTYQLYRSSDNTSIPYPPVVMSCSDAPAKYYDLTPSTLTVPNLNVNASGQTLVDVSHEITNACDPALNSPTNSGVSVTLQLYIKRSNIFLSNALGYPVNGVLAILPVCGNTNGTYKPTNINIGVVIPGDEVCTYITVSPYTNKPGLGGPKSTPERCASAAARPYLKAYGSDVRVGGRFLPSNTCSPASGEGGIDAYATSVTGAYRGSSGQFGVTALLQINGFYSASNHTSDPQPPNGLTFANKGPGAPKKEYGGGFNPVGGICITDYTSTRNTSPAPDVSSGLLPGKKQYTSSGGSTLAGLYVPEGYQAAIYVDGDLFINGNITMAASSSIGADNVANLPYLAIIVRGNIYVSPNVTRLDGLYVAQPKQNSTSEGQFYTCASGIAALYNTTNLEANCFNQLVINGAVIAQKVHFLRTPNDILQAKDNEVPTNFGDGTGTKAAEVINYTPELYMAPSPLVDTAAGPVVGGIGSSYDAIYSLPPVY